MTSVGGAQDRTCPHCGHEWAMHNNRHGRVGNPARCLECGCLWQSPSDPVTPPEPVDLLTARIEDAIWDALGQQDICVDRDMDLIDTSGSGVDMTAVAASIQAALGLTEEHRTLTDGWIQPMYGFVERTYGLKPPPAVVTHESRLVGPWVEETP